MHAIFLSATHRSTAAKLQILRIRVLFASVRYFISASLSRGKSGSRNYAFRPPEKRIEVGFSAGLHRGSQGKEKLIYVARGHTRQRIGPARASIRSGRDEKLGNL